MKEQVLHSQEHSMPATEAPASGPVEQDLGPLAWVLDELRRSLEGAGKALRRFVQESEAARASDLAALDTSALRLARQQLHQAGGALAMVGMEPASLLLRTMEAALQHYVQKPELCTDESARVIDRAGVALLEYLDVVLAGRPISPVALFPQYREVQALQGNDKIHPADLWPTERRLREPAGPQVEQRLAYGPAARAQLDSVVLRIVKSADAQAAAQMQGICLALAAAPEREASQRLFWKVAAGFFDAMAHAQLQSDLYVKRVASRVLLQYAAWAKGEAADAHRLLQDMLFFCAQAGAAPDSALALAAVQQAMDLGRHQPVDYERARFGRFDPAVLAQARKRMAAATELWSALAGGDRSKIKPAVDQFSLVSDSLLRLHPESAPLANALGQVLQPLQQRGEPPTAAIAMEVATAVLYLQAAFATLDHSDAQMAAQAQCLAERLQAVLGGAESPPLEPWMEELYRQVSDHQTMGSVVGELRGTLADTEKLLDQYFREPAEINGLARVSGHLSQMRGVLSVLGLDQASLAMVRMRETVDRLCKGEVPTEVQAPLFDKLGNSLGALGFLIDMLSYQRTMARQLFVYDEEAGELRPLMGRSRARASDPQAEAAALVQARTMSAVAPAAPEAAVPGMATAPAGPVAQADAAVPAGSVPSALPAEVPEATPEQAPATPALEIEESDDELRQIFLDEAREVIAQGREALAELQQDAGRLSAQTTLRRAFHTLKGSSRMVGLDAFGEAGWALEQMLNAWLAEQQPMPLPMQQLVQQALDACADWVEAIARQEDGRWSAEAFREAADAMRLHGEARTLDMTAVRGEVRERRTRTEASLIEAQEDVAPAAAEEAPGDPAILPEALSEPPEVPVTQPLPAAEDIDFADFAAALQAQEASAEADVPAPEAPAAETTAAPPWHLDLNLDLGPAEAADSVPQEPVALPAEAGTGTEAGAINNTPLPATVELEAEAETEAIAETAAAEPGVQVIDGLRIGLPLYNVYLNEAEEWSQQLQQAMQHWAEAPAAPQPASAGAWAHSLAGSSATVGFQALSELARLLEHALAYVEPQGCGQPAQIEAFVRAADEVRGLLHQFAAGFLRQPQAAVLEGLEQVLAQDIQPAPLEQADAQSVDEAPDFGGVEPPAVAEVADEPSSEELQQRLEAAVAHARALDDSQDDDIDALDVIDPDLFPIFEEEAAELLPQLGTALRQWASQPGQAAPRQQVLRALHTLKGSARLAGAMRLGEMAHRLESAVEAIDAEAAQSAPIEALFGRLDALQAGFEVLRAVGARAPNDPVRMPGAEVQAAAPVAPTGAPAISVAPAVAAPTPAVRAAAQQTVRVRAQLLDRLINEAGEVMIARSRLDARMGQVKGVLSDLTVNLERLRQQLRDIEVQAESQMQSRLALSKESGAGFDPLEFDRFTRVQELTRMMAESVNDVATVQRNLQREIAGAEDDLVAQGRQARDLQRDLLRTRMVEFDSVAERLYAVVRVTAKEMGKQVRLDLSGGAIEMDRGVLERMLPAFEHLLRNCVGHGIEAPAVREAAGKPATGAIAIDVRQDGNDVVVAFSDDGAGLDVERIRARAVAQGLVAADAVIDPAQAAQLVFLPGLSTAEEVTGLAGRGIGMDVVRTEVQALGGRIETESAAGQGSTFRLVLPLTTAVTQVVMLRAGAFSVGVPANLVEIVRRVPLSQLEAAYRAGEIEAGDARIPFYWAGAVWQQSARSTDDGVGKTRPVVIFRSAAQRIALHVDEVLGQQEVVVKNLGPQLSRLPGLTGMSVLASGAVVLIYNPVALATVYGPQIQALGQGLPALPGGEAVAAPVLPAMLGGGASQGPLVLVVDDSITVRRVTQRLLQREGYRVAVASDGLQALERLQDELPSVVLSDIEMPRMDGFDLVRNIRADARLQHLPVIMITSRIAQKHRDHARELGVNHYLGKPYGDEDLLRLVQHYTAPSAAAADLALS